VSVFEGHNQLVKQEENLKYSHSTIRQYNTTLSRIREYLKQEYGKPDISLPELDLIFIRRFETYLRTKYQSDHNTVMKYLKQLKKVVHFAMELGHLERDPFLGHKTGFKEANRGFLTPDELYTIESKVIKIKRVDQVRDVFIFACYTGLSYSDLNKLTTESITKGIDGKSWITYYREKTGIRASIPLLPPAQAIIDKYRDDPECNADGKLIPVKSNQKLNSYLSEIEEICDIKKRLTMHLARHTFATTVTLTNGVPHWIVPSLRYNGCTHQ
jgi:integrase